MKTLKELYAEHQGKLSDKWAIYLEEYSRLFAPYRTQEIRLLEIGVQNGGSLEIWTKFFPHAKCLIGCDINPDCSKLIYTDSRVNVVVGDANQARTKNRILDISPQLDIVIDDGSHTSSDIIRSFSHYFPKIKDGGIFIAEDLHCSYWQEFEGGLYDPFSSIAFFKALADVVNHEHWGNGQSNLSVLKGFVDKYNIRLTEQDLASVHSIEFINSICVIRKASAGQNILGSRHAAGQLELVVQGHGARIKNTNSSPLPQYTNIWASLTTPPAEQWLEHKARIEALESELQALYTSSSWRITQPLRQAKQLVRVLKHLGNQLSKFIATSGGLLPFSAKAIRIFYKEGFTGLRRGLGMMSSSALSARNDYGKWVDMYDTLNDGLRNAMRNTVAQMTHKPLISVVMPTYNPNPAWLKAAIESVRSQLYPHWELCIADDASTNPEIHSILETYTQQDVRIKVVFREQNGHISAASNSALALAQGEWVALLDHDDLLSEHALYWLAKTIYQHPDAQLIYSDEDKIDEQGKRSSPYFKPDWNQNLFYSQNYFSHLGAFKTTLLKEIGGFRIGLEGSQDYDLVLRAIERVRSEQILHIPHVLYHWRTHNDSTAAGAETKPYAMIAGEKALNEHFSRQSIQATATYIGYGYRTTFQIKQPEPLVSLIIPTRNGKHLVKQCIDSIFTKTLYKNYEIILVDNGSDDLEALAYFDNLKSDKVRVIRDDSPFNYSALNNQAAKMARGEILGLINNDIEVITPDWLGEMVSHVLRPTIGAVGAKLYYPNNTMQHAGVILGVGGVAGHAHKYLPAESRGYFCLASLTHNLSAVTAACLLVRKSVFEEVGGLNEKDLTVAFNDIDFCLRIKAAGYSNLWTPFAELYHHESISRGAEDNPEKQARFAKECLYMNNEWAHILTSDPNYNPNLTLKHEDYSLAWPPRVESH